MNKTNDIVEQRRKKLEDLKMNSNVRDIFVKRSKIIQDDTHIFFYSALITYHGNNIDLGRKWRRMPLLTAMEEIGGIDSGLLDDREKLLDFAYSKGISITQNYDF